jgi:Uma2 family endonuclease
VVRPGSAGGFGLATVEKLLTAEEFAQLPDDGQLAELVRGRIVLLNMPRPRHGEICGRVVRLLGNHVDEHDLGRVVCNDSGVITERDPDTVRGADVAFYSYARVPKGPLPSHGYLAVAPDVTFEVRSPGDRWSAILTKVAEYLRAGVTAVCVLDPATERAHVYQEDTPVEVFNADEELTLPPPLDGFRVQVGRFFE